AHISLKTKGFGQQLYVSFLSRQRRPYTHAHMCCNCAGLPCTVYRTGYDHLVTFKRGWASLATEPKRRGFPKVEVLSRSLPSWLFRGSMAITDKTRKLLWGRSGNRCALCRNELIMDRTPADDESIVGDEAHIHSGQEGGPRYDPNFPQDRIDKYDNLILLCKI